MNLENITIKDIALALGLSNSTVSKALRRSHEISQDTQSRVIAYAKEHNYHPNPIAQSLRLGKSKTIGVLVANLKDQFYAQVLDGIESLANNKSYTTIIMQSHESSEKELHNLNALLARSLDGLLISLSSETGNIDYLQDLRTKGLPIVFFDRVSDAVEAPKVVCNNFKGAYDATVAAVRNGYRNIGHITSNNELSVTAERLKGYQKALEDLGLPINNQLIVYVDHSSDFEKGARKAVDQLLKLPQRPDAIFCGSDILSTTVFQLLQNYNISIPNEIAIFGFSNIETAAIFQPSFTTISQPAVEMGNIATEILIDLIENKRTKYCNQTITLETKLEQRRSSASKSKQTSK